MENCNLFLELITKMKALEEKCKMLEGKIDQLVLQDETVIVERVTRNMTVTFTSIADGALRGARDAWEDDVVSKVVEQVEEKLEKLVETAVDDATDSIKDDLDLISESEVETKIEDAWRDFTVTDHVDYDVMISDMLKVISRKLNNR